MSKNVLKLKRDRYRHYCEQEGIPLFSQAWWLDIVAKESWDVAMVERNDRLEASMPYVMSKNLTMRMLTQPALTQHLGPWISANEAKYSKQLSRQKELMTELIQQLPKCQFFYQNWHYSLTNWLPFYWSGFEQTTRYTYVIEDLTDVGATFASFQENIRREIRKAIKRNIVVSCEHSIDEFADLNRKTFERQGMALPYSESLVKDIAHYASERGQCKWFIAKDEDGSTHAGVLIVWDSESAYYLLGGGDPSLRTSGATSLCMWEAIKFASGVTKKFDFEGSMIPPIEKFVRGFGAKQYPYFLITKSSSLLLGLIVKILKKNVSIKNRLLRLLG